MMHNRSELHTKIVGLLGAAVHNKDRTYGELADDILDIIEEADGTLRSRKKSYIKLKRCGCKK